MRKFTIGSVSVAFVMILSACGGAEDAGITSSLPSAAETTVFEPTVSPSTNEPDGTEIAPNSDPGEFTVEAQDAERPDHMEVAEVSFATTVQKVATNAGLPDELVIWIEVPEGWRFEVGESRFALDDNNWIEIATSCDGACEPKAWDQSLFQTYGFATLAHEKIGGSPMGGGTSGGSDRGRLTHKFEVGEANVSTSYHYHYGASRFVACNVSVDGARTEIFDEYNDLCEELYIEWGPLVENSPDARPSEVIVSPEIESLLADIAGGVTNGVEHFDVEERVVSLDDDDEHQRLVSMLLPVDARVSPGSFKTEITFGSDLSIFSDLTVKDGCDGICAPQDWQAELTGLSGYIGRRRAGMVVDHDSPIPSGWILAGWDDDEYVVLVTRWNNDASHYFSCLGELDDDDAQYANDMIAMCISGNPNWLD